MIHHINLVDLSSDAQEEAISWARANCPSFRGLYFYENEYLTDDPEYYEFVFEQEHDAILFGLKFGSH